MSISAVIKSHTDEEHFAAEMAEAIKRLNNHIQATPLTAEDVVIDHAKKDAERILNGTTSYTAMAPFRNILSGGNTNPDSSYYGCGEKYYSLYCKTVEDIVKAFRPDRTLHVPGWKEHLN